ncbi:saccharopine dehydrogenase [Amycolatopsis antarctica]|uniref:Saccharopine dehydrogenase n=1 Tax=Amycolatopsis antarctica TaxID=1854586 RepID=A0A263CXS3_9PSEU|nr:saccharopine dehydrogenase NADP-binding domain-containing protein [Amycolatopsis antarctica]OZM70126.1 saccharopine dehydrogenase [Amycolatopsis antarctica]
MADGSADRQASGREYDVVLFGATGFTGELTARYLARHAPATARIALAGRNRAKLETLRAGLAETNPGWSDLPLLHADVGDAASLRAVAASTQVVITTVGPYLLHGEPLVAACAETGTDYVDLSGEPEFVDDMYLRHHARAVETGARIVHACGFDSIPYDLGVLYTVARLPDDVPVDITGAIRASATFSGGTFQSALGAFSRLRSMQRTAAARRKADPRPAGRTVRTPTGRPHRDAGTGRWLVPLPTLDPQIVGRSAAALPVYGPDFTYRHYADVKRLPTIVAAGAGMAVLFAAAQIPPARKALGSLRKNGDGPSARQRAKSWFSLRLVGTAGGERVVTEVSGGDPGYDETAKMLGESALCLAFDDLPATSGQLTPAVAMGEPLVERLVRAGITFRVIG